MPNSLDDLFDMIKDHKEIKGLKSPKKSIDFLDECNWLDSNQQNSDFRDCLTPVISEKVVYLNLKSNKIIFFSIILKHQDNFWFINFYLLLNI